APAGTLHRIVELEITITLSAGTLLKNFTLVPAPKLLPLICTCVPTCPLDGEKLVIFAWAKRTTSERAPVALCKCTIMSPSEPLFWKFVPLYVTGTEVVGRSL